MERFIQKLQDKRLKVTLIYILIGIAIWFGGPYIAIDNDRLLADSTHRLIVALILAILWGIQNIRFTTPVREPKTKSHSLITTSQYVDETTQITQAIRNIIKKTNYKKNKFLHFFKRTSNYFVIGCEKSGRSYFLNDAQKNVNRASGNEKFFQTYAIHGLNYFDINPESRLSFQTIIKSLKKFRYKLNFKGIVVTINLPSFFMQNASQDIQNIIFQLQTINRYYRHLPVYLVFTHCDHIQGFCDFFDDLNQEQRSKPLGFTLNKNNSQSFADHCSIQYDHLLHKLNNRLVQRFHQELNVQKRIRIKDFLLQMEIIKEPLIKLLVQLKSIQAYTTACYFISTTQIGSPLNLLHKSVEHSFNFKMTDNIPFYKKPDKSYFLEGLFSKVFINNTTKDETRKYLVYFVSIFLVLGFTLVWTINYRHTDNKIASLEKALEKSTHGISSDDYLYLPHLTLLYNQLYVKGPVSQLLNLMSLKTPEKINIAAQKTYISLLTNQFMPSLQTVATNEIIKDGLNNPSKLYSALKVYLMLSDKDHRNNLFLRQWYEQYWVQNIADKNMRKQLLTQLDVIIKQQIYIPVNQDVVASARALLAQIPLPQLSFSVLIDQYQQPIKLFDENQQLQITQNYWIPNLYSKAEFNNVYDQKIPQASEEVINGNWVLGKKNSANNDMLIQLTEEVQALYIENYINAWETLLGKITLPNFANLQQISDFTKHISNGDSPLLQILNTISINTTSSSKTNSSFNLISTHFQTLNDFMQGSRFVNFQIALNQLNEYFQANDLSTNSRAAFIAAEKRMELNGLSDALENAMQQFPNLPYPLSNWLGALPNQAWHFILTDAQDYLNQIWQTQILPKYNASINNHYPVFKTATTDSSISEFTRFFAPKGILDSFFNNYLKSFVDTSHVYWAWKVVDNDHINIPATTLEMFIRASLIQKMYFSENTSKPFVRFTLIPQALEPGVLGFNLNLEGQLIHFLPQQPAQIDPLTWPGPNPNTVVLQFINNRNKQATLTEKGPWAWFKILDKGNVQTTLNNPKQFIIMFDLNGNSARYQLVSENLINPFIPGIVTAFRCPDTL